MSIFNKVTKTFQWGKHKVTLETGEIARQASGAVLVDIDGTVVLATVVGSKGRIAEALDFIAARHNEIDVAVLDLNLGGARSYPVASAVNNHGIPIVFSTGYQDGDISDEWRDYPMINKPFQLSELQLAIAQALRTR